MMKNGARYVVETHWGVFSLDEGSYQDYLAGKLWISWKPGNTEEPVIPMSDHVPPHVSAKAIRLRDQADRCGVLSVLQQLGIRGAHIPYSPRLADVSIDELNLTIRSSNGLKRACAWDFGKLMELISSEHGILSVRNLGQKSAREITGAFIEECYLRLFPYERAQYWQEMLDKT